MDQQVFDIKARTFNFSLAVIKLAGGLQTTSSARILSRQLVRSATSIGANLVEGSSASSKKDFINYYHISLKSARETECWLRLLDETGLANGIDEVSILRRELDEIVRILVSSVVKLKK